MLDYEDACKSTQKRQHAVEKMKGTVQVRAEKADIASTELHQAELFEKQIKVCYARNINYNMCVQYIELY
jgi:hypothetical protein